MNKSSNYCRGCNSRIIRCIYISGKDKAQETEVKGTEIVAVQDENGTIEVTKILKE